MKNYIANIAVAIALVIVVFGFDSKAQSPARVVAAIPFDFNVGGETLPAGKYEFTNLNRRAYPGVLIIRSSSSDDSRSVAIPALANDAVKTGDNIGVVFNRYGTSYFLSRIDLRSSDLAVRLTKSSAERRAEKQQDPPVAILIPVTH